MKHPVEGSAVRQRFDNVGFQEREAARAGKVVDVAPAAAGEVVETDHLVAIGHETLGQVRPQKSRAPGYKHTHGNGPSGR